MIPKQLSNLLKQYQQARDDDIALFAKVEEAKAIRGKQMTVVKTIEKDLLEYCRDPENKEFACRDQEVFIRVKDTLFCLYDSGGHLHIIIIEEKS